MEEAHENGSLERRAQALIDDPSAVPPLDRLADEMESAVGERMKGKSTEAVQEALRQDLRDAAFLYNLQHSFNNEFLNRSLFIAPSLTLVSWMPLLPFWHGPDKKAADDLHGHWREMATSILAELYICRVLGERLSETYFAGHSLMYPKAAEDLAMYTETFKKLIGNRNKLVRRGTRRVTKSMKAAMLDFKAVEAVAEAAVPDMLTRAVNGAKAHTLHMMGQIDAAVPLYRKAAYGEQADQP
jgi:hypothetical protein